MSTNKTEYDFQNCIILGGDVYVLTDKVMKCNGVVINDVCRVCSLRCECEQTDSNTLCIPFGAADNEYFTIQAGVYHDTTTDRWYIAE